MGIRAKTKKRLTILISTIVAFIVLIVVLIAWRSRAAESRFTHYRQTGLEAFARGDYVTALDQISRYITPERAATDKEAFFALGKSRRMVPMPEEKHLLEARNYLRELLNRSPDYVPAQDELLDLYDYLNWDTEAILLADKVIAQRPDSTVAFRVKASSLTRQGKFDQALECSRALNEIAPLDLQSQIRTLELMRQANRPEVELTARASDLRSKYPNNPKFEILQALAFFRTEDHESAARVLRAASPKPGLDADSIMLAARLFDAMGLYPDAMTTLERAATTDPKILKALTLRLWQLARYQDVIDKLRDVNGSNQSTPAILLGLKALSFQSTNRAQEASALVSALETRKADDSAAQWAKVLRARASNTAQDFKQMGDIYRQVLMVENNVVFQSFLAEALIALGEQELAIQTCKEIIDLSPSWAQPRVTLSQLLLESNRHTEARAQAELACRCAPQLVATNVNLVKVWYRQLQVQPNAEQQSDLLRFVFRLQQQLPNEPQTLPIYVDLLARTQQRDAAIAAINSAIASRTAPPTQTLLALSALNTEHKLGLEDLIAARLNSGSVSGNPEAAYQYARQLAQRGLITEGAELLRTHADKNPSDPKWQLASAQYLELTDDPAAAATWIKLGNSNPNDLAIQKAIVKIANSVWSDREFLQKSIDRVKALTGDNGIDWRIAQGRLLLETPADDKSRQTNVRKAHEQLTDIVRNNPRSVEALVLCSRAALANGIPSQAVEMLRNASSIDPTNAPVALELLELLQSQNQASDTRQVVERLLASGSVLPDSRLRLIALLIDNGAKDRAMDLLAEPLSGLAEVNRKLMLAGLCRRNNLVVRAEELYRSMFQDKQTTLAAVRESAEFLASRGDMLAARQMLTRLDDLKLKPGVKETVLGAFADRFGTTDQAAKTYLEATRLAPSDPDTWRSLISYHLRHEQYPLAKDFADQAVRANPGNAALIELQRLTEAAQNSAATGDFKSLLSALQADPNANQPAIEALSVLVDARARQISSDELAARMVAVAGKYPKAAGVQSIAAQTCASVRQWDRAAAVALRAMDTFPGDIEAAKLATSILTAAERFEQARRAGEQWRQRTLDNPLAADKALAEIQLAQRDGVGAISRLAPYIEKAKADPTANADLLTLQSRALIQTDRVSEVSEMLLPYAQNSGFWRGQWLELSGAFSQPGAAVTWIEKISPLIKKESREERFALAGAWYNLAQKSNDPAVVGKARQCLMQVAEKETDSTGIWMMLAATHQQAGDLPEAETAYRMALSIEPANATAQNNLAFVLLLMNRKLDDAMKLAERATSTMPDVSGFQDTLARLQLKQGKLEQAVESFKRAVALDDTSLESRLGLADALNRAGQRTAANSQLDLLEVRLKTNSKLSPYLMEQLDDLRKNLRGSSAGTQ